MYSRRVGFSTARWIKLDFIILLNSPCSPQAADNKANVVEFFSRCNFTVKLLWHRSIEEQGIYVSVSAATILLFIH